MGFELTITETQGNLVNKKYYLTWGGFKPISHGLESRASTIVLPQLPFAFQCWYHGLTLQAQLNREQLVGWLVSSCWGGFNTPRCVTIPWAIIILINKKNSLGSSGIWTDDHRNTRQQCQQKIPLTWEGLEPTSHHLGSRASTIALLEIPLPSIADSMVWLYKPDRTLTKFWKFSNLVFWVFFVVFVVFVVVRLL